MCDVMRKGLNATITLIIAIIVMVIVALALIAVTTGNLGSFGEDSKKKIDTGIGNFDTDSDTMKKIKCEATITDDASVCGKISSNCGYTLKGGGKCYWIPDSDSNDIL